MIVNKVRLRRLWLRKPSEITDDEYKSFYAHLANFSGTEYLKAIHMTAEGASEFKALLFLPKQAPFNLLMPDIQKKGITIFRITKRDLCGDFVFSKDFPSVVVNILEKPCEWYHSLFRRNVCLICQLRYFHKQ